MRYVDRNTEIAYKWSIWKGDGGEKEDFSRSSIFMYLLSQEDTIPLDCTINEDGDLYGEIPAGLNPGVYSFKVVWSKDFTLQKRNFMTSVRRCVLGISPEESEADYPNRKALIVMKSRSNSYGSDGFSAYERAYMFGLTRLTEREWISNIEELSKIVNDAVNELRKSDKSEYCLAEKRAHAEGYATEANAEASHAEGSNSTAEAYASHAEGYDNHAWGDNSHAEGNLNYVEGENSHVEGQGNKSSGTASHVEGFDNIEEGANNHVEGQSNIVKGTCNSVGGMWNQVEDTAGFNTINGTLNTVRGTNSAVFGCNNEQNNIGNLVSGVGNKVNNFGETAVGRYNSSSPTTNRKTLFSVGNGTSEKHRSNAFEVRENGDVFIWLNGEYVLLQQYIAYSLDSNTGGVTAPSEEQLTAMVPGKKPNDNNYPYESVGSWEEQ